MAHFGIVLLADAALHELLVVVEALGGVQAGHLQVGQGCEHHEQVPDFDFNVDVGQHGNIGGLDGEIDQLAACGFQAVGGKTMQAQQVLHRFLPDIFQDSHTGWNIVPAILLLQE